jgi:hypothetical protein
VVLEKNGEKKLDRPCEKRLSIARVKEKRSILHTIKRSTANLRRNCVIKHIIEGKTEVSARQRRRRNQLLDDLKETKRCRKLKEEALYRTACRTRFGIGYGHVLRQTTE